jgi:uncharacterized protein YvpB
VAEDPFDFYKGMMGVDIAQVEMVGSIVGKAIGSVYKGMLSVGLTHAQARQIVFDMCSVVAQSMMLQMSGQTIEGIVDYGIQHVEGDGPDS